MIAKKSTAPETDESPRPGVFNAEALLALLREFREGDEEDRKVQERELAEFMRAIDEDRPGERKLFPDQ